MDGNGEAAKVGVEQVIQIFPARASAGGLLTRHPECRADLVPELPGQRDQRVTRREVFGKLDQRLDGIAAGSKVGNG